MTEKEDSHQTSRDVAGGKGQKLREIVLGLVMAVVSLCGVGLGVVRCVQKGDPVSVAEVMAVTVLALFSVVTGIPAIAQMWKMRRRNEESPERGQPPYTP